MGTVIRGELLSGVRSNNSALATSRPLRSCWVFLAFVAVLGFGGVTRANPDGGLDLADLSLEDLLNINVTTVTKRNQRLIDSASAIHVLTADDIRRSGLTSIPELLRLVPGINVARYSTSNWGVSSRGDNFVFNNDLLIMIDGRSVYTPLFGGTFWDAQDVALEDIDRIEVVRGPGGTVWGANAVNGVINIIRKPANAPQDDFVSVAAGDEDRALASMRMTRNFGNVDVRFSGNYVNRDDSHSPLRGDAGDEWRQGTGSVALNWRTSDRDLITLQGDWQRGEPGTRVRVDNATSLVTNTTQSIFNDTTSTRNSNVLARWNRQISETASTQLQFYWDRSSRKDAIIDERRHTYDLEFQNNFAIGDRHQVIWGAGGRMMLDDLENSFNLSFTPADNDEVKYNGFLQDEIQLIPDALKLTLGAKLEWNSYTGWEISPSGRMLWSPRDNQQVWGAISRSVRTPSRAARDLASIITDVVANPFAPPAFLPITATSNPDQESEYTVSYELGYRIQPTPSTSLDIATYYDVLENGLLLVPAGANPLSTVYTNRDDSHFYGLEVAGQWQATPKARFKGSYSFFREGRVSTTQTAPTHKFQVQSLLDLPHDFELDSWLSYYGRTNSGTPLSRDLEGRWRLDVRLGWKPIERLELSLVGQNLLEDETEEITSFAGSAASGPLEVERAFYGRATWRY